MNNLAKTLAEKFIEVIVREIVEQTVSYVGQQGKDYITRTIDKGREIDANCRHL